MEGIEITAQSYNELLEQFAKFYLENKADCDMIVHMGVPVESTVLKDMHSGGYIGDWDGPFPLIDIATITEINTSVDTYNKNNNLTDKIPEFEGGTHNPLYDSYAAAIAYRDVKEKEIERNLLLSEILKQKNLEDLSFDELISSNPPDKSSKEPDKESDLYK